MLNQAVLNLLRARFSLKVILGYILFLFIHLFEEQAAGSILELGLPSGAVDAFGIGWKDIGANAFPPFFF